MTNPNAGSGSGVSGHAFFVAMLAAVAGIAFFGFVGDYVTAAVVGVTAVGALFGYWKGALGFISLGCAVAGGYYLARPVDQLIGPYLGSVISDQGWINPSIQLGMSGVLAAAATQLTVLLVGKSILSRNETLSDLNHTIGIGLGGVQMFAAAAFLLCGFLVIEPLVQPHSQHVTTSDSKATLVGAVSTIAQKTRQSAIHPLLVQYDPFQRFPQLKQSLHNFSQPTPPTGHLTPTSGSSLTNSVSGWLTNNTNQVPPPSGQLNLNSLQDIFQQMRSGANQPGQHP